jgi:MoxR-like ATPase
MKFSSEVEAVEAFQESYQRLKKEIHKRIVGQDEVIDLLLICLFTKGHALLIGVPGLAKTLLIKTLAECLDLSFQRIQFTPDLMPSDILGSEILEIDPETGRRYFKFVKGPIFTQVLLADEINRTPPKTQAALLEAMQELQVTIGGQRYPLEKPFFVLATQNPIEQEGTYPLPEAQLDRFMMEIRITYPQLEEEVMIVKQTTSTHEAEVQKVLSGNDVLYFQELIRKVPVTDNVVEYAVKICRHTRPTNPEVPDELKRWIAWGVGPRASQSLILAAKAHALLHGKFSPDAENVRAVALPILRHRLIPSFIAEADGITVDDIIQSILRRVPVLSS